MYIHIYPEQFCVEIYVHFAADVAERMSEGCVWQGTKAPKEEEELLAREEVRVIRICNHDFGLGRRNSQAKNHDFALPRIVV